jgi:hypothetical protein
VRDRKNKYKLASMLIQSTLASDLRLSKPVSNGIDSELQQQHQITVLFRLNDPEGVAMLIMSIPSRYVLATQQAVQHLI